MLVPKLLLATFANTHTLPEFILSKESRAKRLRQIDDVCDDVKHLGSNMPPIPDLPMETLQ